MDKYNQINKGVGLQMRVITVSGKAESGKDTFALILKSILEKEGKTVLIFHYADLLKFYCKQYFGWNGEKDDAGRTLLQRIGTDIVRSRDEDFWVKQAVNFMDVFGCDFDYILIPDTRFRNEVETMKEMFESTAIYIERINYVSSLTEEQKSHPSENILSKRDCDYCVVNDALGEFERHIDLFNVNCLE